ncbi:hypothetical protein [Nitrosomonas sp. Nm33]|uniref:hypothetical protein n=1 Tax=Nitrosomonas sp. Nm33 TaxID=133724 RepID=UPI00089B2BD2|nr:hypothetical protein [Nitrosomonas sp. Nm33]SDY40161.1 hypothetical protein SAMN05421755_102036 [Nitrosomonas sp. Nm33]
MLIEFDTAHNVMRPYFNGLWSVINGAWEDWQIEISPKVKSLTSARTRACMINDFMRIRGIRLAEENESINFLTKQQMFILVFNPQDFFGCIGIRLKKFDEDGLSRNQPTLQVQEFRNQLLLPGIEATHHLEAGYIMDKFGSSITSINLVCPSGEANYWNAEILPNAINQNVENLFAHESQQIVKEARVRVKSDKLDKKEGDNYVETT